MNVVIAVPVYNNPKTIVKIVEDCLRETELPILVIDDGSALPVQDLLPESEIAKQALEEKRCQVLRHETNFGKGAALKTAFLSARRMNFTHVLTIDGDGQHDPRDLRKLLACADPESDELLIGARMMSFRNSPFLSRLGRCLSDVWIVWITGCKVRDSQSGVRLYPLNRMGDLADLGTKFDFEMEILVRTLWNGASCRSVEIAVHYPEPGERVTHFHKVKDNFRIFRAGFRLAAVKCRDFLTLHQPQPQHERHFLEAQKTGGRSSPARSPDL